MSCGQSVDEDYLYDKYQTNRCDDEANQGFRISVIPLRTPPLLSTPSSPPKTPYTQTIDPSFQLAALAVVSGSSRVFSPSVPRATASLPSPGTCPSPPSAPSIPTRPSLVFHSQTKLFEFDLNKSNVIQCMSSAKDTTRIRHQVVCFLNALVIRSPAAALS